MCLKAVPCRVNDIFETVAWETLCLFGCILVYGTITEPIKPLNVVEAWRPHTIGPLVTSFCREVSAECQITRMRRNGNALQIVRSPMMYAISAPIVVPNEVWVKVPVEICLKRSGPKIRHCWIEKVSEPNGYHVHKGLVELGSNGIRTKTQASNVEKDIQKCRVSPHC
jgi:hypothetical protein